MFFSCVCGGEMNTDETNENLIIAAMSGPSSSGTPTYDPNSKILSCGSVVADKRPRIASNDFPYDPCELHFK